MYPHPHITISLAGDRDRQAIYAIRHDVYARELKQHAENRERALRDRLDEVNVYLVATENGQVVGFVAVTPPGTHGYSLDKYFDRDATGLRFDAGLYEIRLLTVIETYRHTQLATLLMYSAFRYVESRGGTTIAAIGRLDLVGLYERVGLKRRGLYASAGAVTYELMSANVREVRALTRCKSLIRRMEHAVERRVPGVSCRETVCYHGGAFWDRLGDGFETLERRETVINADVLDAWFDPAPAVSDRLVTILPFALRTSPPTHAEGLRRAIAQSRGVPESCVLPGEGRLT